MVNHFVDQSGRRGCGALPHEAGEELLVGDHERALVLVPDGFYTIPRRLRAYVIDSRARGF